MEHTHQWRATSKVFALVCECGVVYHDWLKVEIEKLRTLASSPSPQEADALRAELATRRTELDAARAELDEARRELEFQAAEIADVLTKNAVTSTS